MGAGSNPAALGLLFTWTRGTQGVKLLQNMVSRSKPISFHSLINDIPLVISNGVQK